VTHLSRSLVLGASILALAACGPEDLGSPGVNGDINIGTIDNSTGGGGSSGGGSGGTGGVTPANGCPTIGTDVLQESGTISGPEGEWLVCTLPSAFTEDANLPYVPGLLYAMNGRVDVGGDDGPTADASDGITGVTVELSIDPGVIIYASTGRSYMVVQRGSTIEASGTSTMPIIFTSRDNVLGNNNNASSQQWGGLVMLGRAPVSDCSSGTPNPVNRIDCQQELEGALNPPSFGGNTPNDYSGTLEYVQLRYSGFTLASGSELQSLTTGGIGNATVISHVQSFNSSDDGVELFGGEPKLDHFIVVGAEDDSFDIDTGAKADIQYAIAVQRSGVGDNALELDSPDGDYDFTALPRTNAQFSNFTFVATGSGSQAIRARGRADLTMVNGVVVKPGGNCLRIDEEDDAAAGSRTDENGPPLFMSTAFECTSNAALTTYAGDASNTTGYTNTLTGSYLNGASEDGYMPIFDVTSLSTYFAATTFIGGVSMANDWTTGWTCDSATVSFGSGESCLSLPVY